MKKGMEKGERGDLPPFELLGVTHFRSPNICRLPLLQPRGHLEDRAVLNVSRFHGSTDRCQAIEVAIASFDQALGITTNRIAIEFLAENGLSLGTDCEYGAGIVLFLWVVD